MGFSFEKLKVYQKSLDFAESVCRITDEFPSREQFGISSQWRRAATSISLNIAEGAGRETKPDRKRFYIMARSSLFENIPLIEISRRLSLLSGQKAKSLRENCEELSKMLRGLIKSLD
jgi:four helix bundle protein